MKSSELIKLITEIVKEEFANAPKFGDIQPTDQKTGERPGMDKRPKDGMDISQQKEMLNSSDKLDETCAIAGGAVVATSDGSAFESEEKQEKKHEQMWSEEKIGKSGPNGPTYFQVGGSLPDALYNQKNGKPSRDPGIAGIKEGFYHGTTATVEPGQYLLPPVDTGNISEKGRKKNLDRVFFTKDLGSAKIYAGRAKQSLGGEPKIYLIEPEGPIDTLNDQAGTTVFMSPKAKVVKRVM